MNTRKRAPKATRTQRTHPDEMRAMHSLYPTFERLDGLDVEIVLPYLRLNIKGPKGLLNIWSYNVIFTNNTSRDVTVISRAWLISYREVNNTTTVRPVELSLPLSPGNAILVVAPGKSSSYSAGIASFESSVLLEGGFVVQSADTYYAAPIRPTTFMLKTEDNAQISLDITALISAITSDIMINSINQYISDINTHGNATLRIDTLRINPDEEALISAFLIYEAHINPNKTRRIDISALFQPHKRKLIPPLASTDNFMVRHSHWSHSGRLFLSPCIKFSGNKEDYESIFLGDNVTPIFRFPIKGDVAKLTHLEKMKQRNDEDALINALFEAAGVAPEKRMNLKTEFRVALARATRPSWNDRLKYKDLCDLNAPCFLKRVHAQEIGPNGSVDVALLRSIDFELMESVSSYIRIRRARQRKDNKRDMGDAKGLVLKGTIGRPKKPRAGAPPTPL